MILIADGGSTKVDWTLLDNQYQIISKIRTEGLNPAVVEAQVLLKRLQDSNDLFSYKDRIDQVFFYGAGCGTSHAIEILNTVFHSFFVHTSHIFIGEDMLAAAYAAASNDEAIVCILGTGSNSCYFDGKQCHTNSVSLGYMIMDEASGNYFGKILLRDYFYKRMPSVISNEMEKSFDLDPNFVKKELYTSPNPNTYLAHFASIMHSFKDENYIKQLVKDGFKTFFDFRVLPLLQDKPLPLYFIGSIAYFFKDILSEVADEFNMELSGVIRRPIDALIAYHKENQNTLKTDL